MAHFCSVKVIHPRNNFRLPVQWSIEDPAACKAKRRQVPLRRSGKGRMNLREPRRQNKGGAVAGGSTEGVTPFFGPAALTTGFKIPTLLVTRSTFAWKALKCRSF